MAYILWTDGEGAGSLTNEKAAPGDRLANFTPKAAPIGPAVTGLGTGDLHRFRFRSDYTAYFEIAGFPVGSMLKALRLQHHLMNGGKCTVVSDDALAQVFANVGLAEGTEPEIQFTDRQNLEYTLALTLRANVPFAVFYTGGGAGGVGSAVPPELKLWWKTESLIGIAATGDNVSGIADSSGNGNNGTEASAIYQPLYEEGQLNGYPALRFAVGRMTSPETLDLTTEGSSFFMVLKRSGPHIEHGIFARFATIGAPSLDQAQVKETHGGDGSEDKVYWHTAAGGAHPIIAASLTTDWFVYAIQISNAATALQYFNGVADAGGTFDPHSDADGTLTLRIGEANMQFVEARLYNSHSASLVSTANSLLLAKYGLT